MNALDALQAEYAALCAKRDAVDATLAPIKVRLEAANERAQAAQAEANAIAAELNAARGDGPAWLELKKSIGATANAIMALKRAKG